MQWLLGAAQAVKEVVPRGTFEVAGRRPDSRTAAGQQPDSRTAALRMWNFLWKDFERPGISHQPHIFRTVKPLVSRIQQQKLLADGGFAYVYSGLDADSGDRMGSMWTTDTMDTILPASSSHVRAVRSGWPFEEFCCRTRRRSPKPRRDTARHRKTTTPGLKLVDIWWTSGGLC